MTETMHRARPASGRWRTILACVFAALLLMPAGTEAAGGKIVVASKIDTEGSLLGNVILKLLAARGLPVENRLQLGPTNIVRAAILAGEIDIYPEYTGNGALFFHLEKDPVWKDWKEGYRKVKALDFKKNRLVWLAPAAANNTWAIALQRDVARAHGIKTMSQLASFLEKGGRIKLAASAEFVESPAALPAFEKAYGFHLSESELLILSGGNTAATLRAAAQGISGVDAAMAYGTDGELAALHLVLLEDDKHAEPVYAPAPVVRAATLARFPQIRAALDPVFSILTRRTLQRLNAAIAVVGEPAATVASNYLKEKHFLP